MEVQRNDNYVLRPFPDSRMEEWIFVQTLQTDGLQVLRGTIRMQPPGRHRLLTTTCRSVSVAVSARNGGLPVSIS